MPQTMTDVRETIINGKTHKILTLRMQQILECSVTEIGISLRNAEALEKVLNIYTVADLLQCAWDDLCCVPNLSVVGIKEIEDGLENNGFFVGEKYVDEQDTLEFKQRQIRKEMGIEEEQFLTRC